MGDGGMGDVQGKEERRLGYLSGDEDGYGFFPAGGLGRRKRRTGLGITVRIGLQW